MDMYYVDKRKKSLNNTILQESYISIDTLKNNCITHPNHNNILKFVDNYKHFIGEHNSFNVMLDIVSEYYINSKDKNFKDILLSISNAIPLETNLRDIKESVQIFGDETSTDVSYILAEIDNFITADRILNNYEKINKRFDIDKFINEYKLYVEQDKISLIEELCFKMDTFNCSKELRYNIALENITYEFYKKGISVDKETLLSTITEYFAIQNTDIESVLEINTIFTEKVKMGVLNKLKSRSTSKVREFITKLKSTEIKTPEQIRPVLRLMYSQSPQQVLDDLPNFFTWFRTFIAFSTFTINPYIGIVIMLTDQIIASRIKKGEAERMIQKYKHEKDVSQNKLNKLKSQKAKENLEKYIKGLDESIEKLENYRDSLYSERGVEDMHEMSIEKRRILDAMNEGVTRGYRPYFMDTNKFFNKYYSEYVRECSNILQEMDKYHNCTGIKESLNINWDAYKEIRPNNIHHYLLETGEIYSKIAHVDSDKVDMMANNLGCLLKEGYYISVEDTDKGSDIYLMTEYCIEPDKEIIHKDILEKAEIIKNIEESLTYVVENSNILVENTKEYFNELDSDILNDLTLITSMNEFVNNSEMLDVINENMNDMTPEEWEKFKKERDARENLKYKYVPINKDANIYRLVKMKDTIKDVKEAFEILSEGSAITNNLLIAKEKIRKAAVSLSDKDKQYSHQLDNLVDNMINKTGKNLTNKNREAVIKGSILPSASAVVKLAIASCAVGVINPALSVIAFLGGLAVAKVGTEKERQYILDEIEIELKLVDKKIQLAEHNDDTKALEQLYRVEKQLKREQTRIKYNKKDFRPIESER